MAYRDFPGVFTDEKQANGLDGKNGLADVSFTVHGYTPGRFVYTQMAEFPFLGDIPERYAPYRFDQMRFRSYRTILFDCNWKTAVDSFNEGYHPQGLHPQMLTWFDDSMFVYEQIGQHSAYRQRERRREMGPSPRLGLARSDYDESALLAERVEAMKGLFTRADQAVLTDLKAALAE